MVWLCFYTQYSFSVFKKGEFEYQKWIQLLSIFVFYEYEYIDIFVNIVETKDLTFFEWCDVYEWEKLLSYKRGATSTTFL